MATNQMNDEVRRRFTLGGTATLNDGTDDWVFNRFVPDSLEIAGGQKEAIFDRDQGAFLQPRAGETQLTTVRFQVYLASDQGASEIMTKLRRSFTAGEVDEWTSLILTFPAYEGATSGSTFTLANVIVSALEGPSAGPDGDVVSVEFTSRQTTNPWSTYAP